MYPFHFSVINRSIIPTTNSICSRLCRKVWRDWHYVKGIYVFGKYKVNYIFIIKKYDIGNVQYVLGRIDNCIMVLLDRGPYCGVTGTLCFRLRMTAHA